MAVRIKASAEELKKEFADILGEGVSHAAILVSYYEGDQIRTEVGIPYSVLNEKLVIGPYLKDIITSPPVDYEKRKKSIPVDDIFGFKRIELSDLKKNIPAGDIFGFARIELSDLL